MIAKTGIRARAGPLGYRANGLDPGLPVPILLGMLRSKRARFRSLDVPLAARNRALDYLANRRHTLSFVTSSARLSTATSAGAMKTPRGPAWTGCGNMIAMPNKARTGDGQSRSILGNRRKAILAVGLIRSAILLAIAWFYL